MAKRVPKRPHMYHLLLLVIISAIVFIFEQLSLMTHGRTYELSSASNPSFAIPSIPSLALMGPPKAGTRSFINYFSKYNNVVQWPSERAFWCGANKIRCSPKLNDSEWMSYINGYESNTMTLGHLVDVIQSHHSNRRCTVSKNKRFWIEKTMNATCIHPKYALEKYNPDLKHDMLYTSKPHNYCYLVEKGPSQSRVAWVPILHSHLMPRTKTFIVVRNPVYHVMSCFTSFSKKHKQKRNQSHIELKHIIVNEIKQQESFLLLTNICRDINKKWHSVDKQSGIQRFLQLKQDYKSFIATYLWRKFVDKDIQPRGLRQDIFIWAPIVFPVFLIALFSYDEILDNSVWNEWTPINSYKVVQFEWLYADLSSSMKVIKCWMMELNAVECDKHISDDENKQLFERHTIIKHNHNHKASDRNQRYPWYEKNIKELFGPCFTTMKHIILYDRPTLLLGQWKSWNYTYI